MDSDAQACPVCGQPVDTVVKRHKTLGAWVPVWGSGPCRNPDCARYDATGRPAHDVRPAHGDRPAHDDRAAGVPAPPERSGPEKPPAAGRTP
ncbi:hypothetical protein [Streptomyces sp. NRRL S-1022]|uniref:hypothetical protein n=1 Tax=Streptomyces sp. NRRL S-1022 TaxID=1463880 RepID=UPI0004BF694B|nr:hypothetical protein [Streptomyces sp. NRRL S-1022]